MTLLKTAKIYGIGAIVGAIIGCFATAHGSEYFYGNDDVIGITQTHQIAINETLYDIARSYDMGVIELLAANPGTDLWTPVEGSTLILPSTHLISEVIPHGILINIAALRLYYFKDEHTVLTFPIGIGREGFDTPEGVTTVTMKRLNPVWIPPDSIRRENPSLPKIVPAGPENPLGAYAINLGFERISIHGTNRPWSIGTRSSHGCMRMYPEDIATLFKAVEKGAKVMIINQPVLLGMVEGKLYIEAHPTLQQSSQLYDGAIMDVIMDKEVQERIISYLSIREHLGILTIDWELVAKTLAERRGYPVIISK